MEPEIRFIKLGGRGSWEKSCIEEDNTIRLGYESPHHKDCLKNKWGPVEKFWLKARKGDQGTASRDINQIKDFYTLSETDIWITFYKRKMYWCHAQKDVLLLEDESRIRRVLGAWNCEDKNGTPLVIENIDGRVTKVQGFRGTICRVALPEYLLRKIDGNLQPEVEAAKQSLINLKADIEKLIKGLWWNDFELLVDLIFSKSGWQRISVLGKTEKDIDLDVFSPVTQKRAFVQVKSETAPVQIQEYYNTFVQYEQYDEMYFVFHSMSGSIEGVDIKDGRFHLWGLSRVAELVIHAGLIDWLITKRT